MAQAVAFQFVRSVATCALMIFVITRTFLFNAGKSSLCVVQFLYGCIYVHFVVPLLFHCIWCWAFVAYEVYQISILDCYEVRFISFMNYVVKLSCSQFRVYKMLILSIMCTLIVLSKNNFMPALLAFKAISNENTTVSSDIPYLHLCQFCCVILSFQHSPFTRTLFISIHFATQ